MALLKKYDLGGKQVGEVSIEDEKLEVSANSQMIKDYIIAMRRNARQWSANTKTRAEVNHSGQKPHPQKGTGRARQGYLGSPQYKGGGRVFTPKPKFDQHVSINKREKRLAIRYLICERIKAGGAHVLQMPKLKEPKTQKVAAFLEQLALSGKRVLFLAEAPTEAANEKYLILNKSLRNIPKIQFTYFPNVSGYDLTLCQQIVILEPAVEELLGAIGG